MNWFARYGIPGTYFNLLLLAFYLISVPELDANVIKEIGEFLIAAFAASIIPTGFIIVIISQLVYCHSPIPKAKYGKKYPNFGVLNTAWQEAKGGHLLKEYAVNAKTTFIIRVGREYNPDELNKARWLQEWFAKRFDVMTIDISLIIATVLGWILFFLYWLLLRAGSATLNVNHLYLGGLSVFIILVSLGNWLTLRFEVKCVATDYFKTFNEE